MATIPVSWDNTAVNASANSISQRVSKRIKAIGGAWDTTGFSPANDLPKTASNTDATVIANRVYEFKVEAICSSGGPTPNNNGIKDGIVFECINPSFVATYNSVQVVINVINTDLTKARIKIWQQGTDVLAGTQIPVRVGDTITANFTGLTAGTNYYVTIEFYAIVDGIEVISSDVAYLGDICGGDVANYQTATSAAPSCPAPSNLTIGPLP